MNLLLSADCPIFRRENRRFLLQVLVTLEKYNHTIVRPATPVLRELLGEEDWRTFGEPLTKVLNRASGAAHFSGPEDCDRCDPAGLADYLSQKTVLIVENAVSDGKFIQLILRRIAPGVECFMSAQVDIRTGGGIANIPRELDLLASAHVRKVPSGMAPRFLVLVDSDRSGPGRESAQARAARKAAARHCLPIHVLAKRSIENYVPDVELEREFAGGDKGDLLAAVLDLGADHRDYFPMKKGIPKNAAEGGGLPPYPSSIPRDVGFGDFIGGVLRDGMRDSNREQIRMRDHSDDLKAFADLLDRSM